MTLRLIALVLLAILAGSFGVAYAAKTPDGSYRDSCRSASVSGGTLRAQCERSRHRRVWARLSQVSSCIGDISNHGGQLICLRKRDLPRGDWSDSCSNPHLAAPGVFAATCRSLRGGSIDSTITLERCAHGVTNARGHLGCMTAKAVEAPPPAASRAAPPPAAPPEPDVDEPDEPAGPSEPAPAGPYQSNCRDVAFDGRYLSGECRDDRGRWKDTSLDTKSCAADQVIGSDDGDLVCTRRPGQEPPAGAYRNSCRDVTFDGRFIRAACKDATGAWTRAVLDMRPCKAGYEIVNEDAELICRAPAPPPPPPAPAAPPAPPREPTAPGSQ